MEKLFLIAVIVIIVALAVTVYHRVTAPPKDSKGSARRRSKPTKQKKR